METSRRFCGQPWPCDGHWGFSPRPNFKAVSGEKRHRPFPGGGPDRADVASVCWVALPPLAADGVFDLGASELMGAAWGARREAASQSEWGEPFAFAPLH